MLCSNLLQIVLVPQGELGCTMEKTKVIPTGCVNITHAGRTGWLDEYMVDIVSVVHTKGVVSSEGQAYLVLGYMIASSPCPADPAVAIETQQQLRKRSLFFPSLPVWLLPSPA